MNAFRIKPMASGTWALVSLAGYIPGFKSPRLALRYARAHGILVYDPD